MQNRSSIFRKRKGAQFSYHNSNGKLLSQSKLAPHIKSLKIPPAWREVIIASNANAKILATGLDAKGRKQYIYNPNFRAKQDHNKYLHVAEFAKQLPKIRRRVRRDLKRNGLDKNKILAAIVYLMEATLIRVGNEEYAKSNKSYGLTTMLDQHVSIKGSSITFSFLGKSKKQHSIEIKDHKLAQLVRKCRNLPGKDLFQYIDETGGVRDIKSTHVNEYIREICKQDFSAKDFRTWAGTVLAAMALNAYKDFDSNAIAKKNVRDAIESVAKKLGNTPTICRKCYIHPSIINSYVSKNFIRGIKTSFKDLLQSTLKDFNANEGIVLGFLQKELKVRRRFKS